MINVLFKIRFKCENASDVDFLAMFLDLSKLVWTMIKNEKTMFKQIKIVCSLCLNTKNNKKEKEKNWIKNVHEISF